MPLPTAIGTSLGLLRRIREASTVRLKAVLGIPMPIDTPDRRILEDVILPAYAARADLPRVLWVGCETYTAHYRRFFHAHEYWTLEPAWKKRLYGGRRHVTATLENLQRHFASDSLDLIFCNGICGWGLDRLEDAEVAFERCFDALRPGGELLVGWNDREPWRPFRPEDITSLRRFRPKTFEPLGTWRCPVEGEMRHVFDFYDKPMVDESVRRGQLG